jgi:hypothetical protein
MQIDFFGLALATGESLRYQYKLEGTGDDWSQPSAERTANYPNIPAGNYRFLIRAVNSDGFDKRKSGCCFVYCFETRLATLVVLGNNFGFDRVNNLRVVPLPHRANYQARTSPHQNRHRFA